MDIQVLQHLVSIDQKVSNESSSKFHPNTFRTLFVYQLKVQHTNQTTESTVKKQFARGVWW